MKMFLGTIAQPPPLELSITLFTENKNYKVSQGLSRCLWKESERPGRVL